MPDRRTRKWAAQDRRYSVAIWPNGSLAPTPSPTTTTARRCVSVSAPGPEPVVAPHARTHWAPRSALRHGGGAFGLSPPPRTTRREEVEAAIWNTRDRRAREPGDGGWRGSGWDRSGHHFDSASVDDGSAAAAWESGSVVAGGREDSRSATTVVCCRTWANNSIRGTSEQAATDPPE